MSTAERKRAKNLTREDVELFTNLVFKFRKIIENKKTDGVTVKQKNDAWIAIAKEYSASASHPRTAEQLRNYYKNTKSNLKKELAREKVDHFLTGGGSATVKKTIDTPLLQIVQAEVTPLSNPYDSASGYFNDRAQPSTSRGIRDKHQEAFEEFLRLGGDPATLEEENTISSFHSDTFTRIQQHPISQPSSSRSKRDKHQEAYEEFLQLGGDPAILGEDVENAALHSNENRAHSPVFVGSLITGPSLDDESDTLIGPTTPPAVAPTTPLPVALTTPVAPDGSNVIRNNKRQRVNFNTLREYVGELGGLKKKKLELQNKVLELQIKKLERELKE